MTYRQTRSLYRVDKFFVPIAARGEFLERVHATHKVLRAQAGLRQDLFLEQSGGAGRLNFITLFEWENAEAVAKATTAVATLHQSIGFDRNEMVARLGIEADIGVYGRVED